MVKTSTSNSFINALLHEITLNGYGLIISTCYNFLLFFFKYVLIYENRVKTCAKRAGMFPEKRSDTVHTYGHVVLRVLSASCTLNTLVQAVKITANEPNEPNKAELRPCKPKSLKKSRSLVFHGIRILKGASTPTEESL